WQPSTGLVPAQDQPGSENSDQGIRAGQGTMAGLDSSTGQDPDDQIPTWPPCPGNTCHPTRSPCWKVTDPSPPPWPGHWPPAATGTASSPTPSPVPSWMWAT